MSKKYSKRYRKKSNRKINRKISNRKSSRKKSNRKYTQFYFNNKCTIYTSEGCPDCHKARDFLNKKWTIYTSEGCPYCHKAREFLNKKKIDYNNISIDNNEGLNKLKDLLKKINKKDYNYIPVIITPSGEFLGGYSDLTNFFKK